MSLHHFQWQGKERTVSVDRRRKAVTILRFIDEEIIAFLGSTTLQLIPQRGDATEGAKEQEIIRAVEEVTGRL